MEELNIEQKAQRYDEAKYIMKKYLESGNAGVIAENTIKKAFPELKESEDEKIRKWLICYFKEVCDNVSEKEKKGVLAWLEKQGEQKPTEWSEKTKGLDELETYILSIVPNRPLDAIKVDSKNIRFLINKEQKPAWSEEDESNFNELSSFIFETYRTEDASRLITWFKSLKDRVQPQVNVRKLIEKLEWLENTKTTIWSEDDEAMRKTTLQYLENTKGSCAAACVPYIVKCIDWLNSLKDRVQPKQEWSEEDEYHKRQILRILKDNGCSQTLQERTEKWIEERLKSLRPQSQWKPSDEQIKAIEFMVRSFGESGTLSPYGETMAYATSLLNDLKKLREE